MTQSKAATHHLRHAGGVPVVGQCHVSLGTAGCPGRVLDGVGCPLQRLAAGVGRLAEEPGVGLALGTLLCLRCFRDVEPTGHCPGPPGVIARTCALRVQFGGRFGRVRLASGLGPGHRLPVKDGFWDRNCLPDCVWRVCRLLHARVRLVLGNPPPRHHMALAQNRR